ncbi:MAG: S9 family peptidase [Acidimicrobiia bacterium]
MEPRDLADVSTPSDPRLHPDGTRVALAVSRININDDRYDRSIWLWDGETERQFTHGPDDGSPRWSPDGSRLAFLRKGLGDDDQTQVAVMAARGGEASIVSNLPLGVETIEWSPSGDRLIAVGVDWAEGWAGLDDEERTRRPRRIERIPFRFDNKGWLHDRRRHLYLIDPSGSEPARCVTSGDFDEGQPYWRPDGRAVAFISARHERRGLEPGVEILEVDLESGEQKTLVDRGAWTHVSYRPDGVAHAVGQPDPWAHPNIFSLWRIEASDELTDLTGHLDRSVTTYAPAIAPAGPQWVGSAAITCLEDAGRVKVVRVEPDGTVDLLLEGDRAITGVSPSGDGGKLAYVAVSAVDPGELYVFEFGKEQRVTNLNRQFRAGESLVEPEHFTVISGGQAIDVFVYLPAGEEAVPVLLNIHGGPATQYGYTFSDEFQVYVGAGYGIVACNPRGASGRGVDFVRAVRGEGWGVVDEADVMAALDAALERFPRLDAGRVGVMGGSYGGFLTAWLIARHDRFASAVVERALLNWLSFGGTSDIAATFGRMYLDVDAPAGHGRLWEASPLSLAHQITTPTLIIHSENDFRCPIEQAEQLFMMLKKRDVDSALLRFPGEGHELSRSGKPKHRVERFQAILDWHQRYLAEDPADLPI